LWKAQLSPVKRWPPKLTSESAAMIVCPSLCTATAIVISRALSSSWRGRDQRARGLRLFLELLREVLEVGEEERAPDPEQAQLVAQAVDRLFRHDEALQEALCRGCSSSGSREPCSV
jgi:hypothetical protein